MRKIWTSAFVVSWFVANAAIATLPDDQTIEYLIRIDPWDEQSSVMFQVLVDAEAIEIIDGVVKWEVSEMRFEEFGSNGAVLSSWTETSPSLDTVDGYWWVDHQDPEDIQTQEFGQVPTTIGVADSDASGDDLEYAIASGSLTKNEEAMYGGKVAGFNHQFMLENEEEPIVEGEDEPGEIRREDDGPSN